MPCGAAPLLAGIIEQRTSHDVECVDLNLQCFEYFLEVSTLRQAVDDLGAIASVKYPRAESIVASAPKAVRSIQSVDSFYDVESFLRAKADISAALGLLSTGHDQLAIGPYSYSNERLDTYDDISVAISRDDGPAERFVTERALPRLVARSPDVVGVSVSYYSQLVPTFYLISRLKKSMPSVHVVLGGPIITWGADLLASDPRFGRWFDSALLGEADDSLPMLLEWLTGGSLEKVFGAILYTGGRVVCRPAAPRAVDLDDLPTPLFGQLPLERYFSPSPVLPLTPSRGCYFNRCTFCNYSFIKLAPYRMRNADKVAADLVELKSLQHDSAFCLETDVLSPRDLKRLADALLEADAGVSWHGVARFERGLSLALLHRLRRSGCTRLYMGLESGSDRILAKMRKGTSTAEMHRLVTGCEAAGIALEVGVLFGFPGERTEDAAETYEFIRAHQHALTRVDAGKFRLLKGSPIADEAVLNGLVIDTAASPGWQEIRFESLGRDGDCEPDVWLGRVADLYPENSLVDVAHDILYANRFVGGFRAAYQLRKGAD
jgi:anaerobic magnesium-protoporphyrin IX monomethyl ester cyclase